MDMNAFWMATDPASSRHAHPSSSSTQEMVIDGWFQNSPSKDRPSVGPAASPSVPPAPAATNPAPATTTPLELDFNLDDLAGSSTSQAMLSPTSYFHQPYGYYVNYSPYTTAWPPQVSQSPIPVSGYSSLLGATNPASSNPQGHAQSSQPSTSQLQPQSAASQAQGSQHSPPLQHATTTPQQMLIDSALSPMNMNGSGSSSLQHQFQASNYPSQSSSHQQPYTFTQPLHNLYSNPYYRPHTSSSQGTLSPDVLHSASTMMSAGIHPHMFYNQAVPLPPSASASTSTSSNLSATATSQAQAQFQQQQQQFLQQQQQLLEEQQARDKKERFERTIRPFLFTGAASVQNLVEKILDYGVEKVEPSLRMEILTEMRDKAPNHYFRAWLENEDALTVTRSWLRTSLVDGASPEQTQMTTPLLQICDRLPFTVEALVQSKIGKLVVRARKHHPTPAVKDMAKNIEEKWRQLTANTTEKQKSNPGEDARSKKRKLNEHPAAGASSKGGSVGSVSSTSSSLPPAKKPAVGTSTSTKPVTVTSKVKSEGKSTTSSSATLAAKSAGADASFFSAPKPKAKLPSFKKAPIPVKQANDNVVDPFQEALKMMKVRKGSPGMNATPSLQGSTSTPPLAPGVSKNGGKKKSVTWAPDSSLVAVKIIERAVYDDDVDNAMHISLRELDRGEGAAMHAQLFEEVIDWSEPLPLRFPHPDLDKPRGVNSQEKDAQAKREQTALGALYMNLSQVPESPAEPTSVIAEDQVDVNVVTMHVGDVNEELFFPPESMGMDMGMGMAMAMGLGMGGAPGAVDGTDPATLTANIQAVLAAANANAGNPTPDFPSILENLKALQHQPVSTPAAAAATDPYAAGQPNIQSMLQQLMTGQQQQQCKFGDQCDFAHETAY